MRPGRKELILYCCLHLVLIFIGYQFFFIGRPWLRGLFDNIGYPPFPNFFSADPYVYWKFGALAHLNEIPLNIFGPTYFFKFLGGQFELIFAVNLALIIYSIVMFSKAIGRNAALMLLMILANPIIFSQVFFVNKELYMLCAGFILLAGEMLNLNHLRIFSLLLLVFTKLEFIVMILFWMILKRLKLKFQIFIIAAIVILVSLLYDKLPGMANKTTVLIANQNGQSMGLNLYLQELAEKQHLYLLVILPRTILNVLTGFYDSVRTSGFQISGLAGIVSSVVMSLLLLIATYRGFKERVRSEHIFIILWFILSATIPFVLHRYLIPIYPFLFAICFIEVKKYVHEKHHA